MNYKRIFVNNYKHYVSAPHTECLRSTPLLLTFTATQKRAHCAHNKVTYFAHTAKFARVKANLNQSQNKYCLRNNLLIISTPKSIPCKQPPFTVTEP